jgi:Phage protein Gp138 N-terminal domain
MDPRERINDLRVAVAAAMRNRQANIWTLLPAAIVSYDAVKMTAAVQPQIIITILDPLTGGTTLQQMPVINDCPVEFPGGGGFHLTFPVQPGDECTVAFSSRCIDGWWATGAMSQQGDLRMHDLSDGFVRVGVKSMPKALSSVSTTAVQLRSDDGAVHVEIASGHVVNIVAPGDVNITGNLNVTGNVKANGEVTAEAASSAITLSTHVHGGVQIGGHDTTGPIG